MKINYFTVLLIKLIALTLFSGNVSAAGLQVSVTDDQGQPVPDVVVYLNPESTNSDVVTALEKFEIDQRNKAFHPFVSVVPTGTSIFFPNRDGIGHHVYSFSPAKKFELPLSEEEISYPIVFDKQGVVTVGCNIHDWMVAYIYIVDSPYYATTNNNGSVTINQLPSGSYMVNIWHPGMKEIDVMNKPVKIETEPVVHQEFTINLRPQYLWKPVQPPDNEEELY